MSDTITISIYVTEEKMTALIRVEQLSNDTFRTTEDESLFLNSKLKVGTEFKTRLNAEGKHEIVAITKESEYITRQFFLTSQFSESEYELLGDEIIKQKGYWQVEMGSIATISLPRESTLNIDEIFAIFDFHPTEII